MSQAQEGEHQPPFWTWADSLHMKHFILFVFCALFAVRSFAQAPTPATLHVALKRLKAQSQAIAQAATNQEKAKAWLVLNRQAERFSKQMNQVFPHSSIHGDRISPPEAQKLAQRATAYGVRVDFCEPGAAWHANNEGYFKYLELWPDGPEADLATWMGPVGHQSSCGDFEGSVEELQEVIQKNQHFISQFPNSRFTPEAKKTLADAKKMLAEQQQLQQHK